jgi:hypothetical protein
VLPGIAGIVEVVALEVTVGVGFVTTAGSVTVFAVDVGDIVDVVPVAVFGAPATAVEATEPPIAAGSEVWMTHAVVAVPLLDQVVLTVGAPLSLETVVVGPLTVFSVPVASTNELVGPTVLLEFVVTSEIVVPSMVVSTRVAMALAVETVVVVRTVSCDVPRTVLRLTTWS